MLHRKAVLAILATVFIFCCTREEDPVEEASSSLEVSPPETVVPVGERVALRAFVVEGGGRKEIEAAWRSSDPDIAKVDELSGEVEGIFPGETELVATHGELEGHVAVTVRSSVRAVRVSPAVGFVLPGERLPLEAVAVTETGRRIDGSARWESSDVSVATVDEHGIVTGQKVGEVEIRVEVEGIEGAASIHVTPFPPASVEVLPGDSLVEAGSEVQFRAVVRDRNGQVLEGFPIHWESSSVTVLAMREDGRGRILRPAKAEVIASVGAIEGRARVEGFLDYVRAARVFNVAEEGASVCAISSKGIAYCWGDNGEGQLGDGTTRSTAVPVRVVGAPPFVDIVSSKPAARWGGAPRRFRGITEDGKVYVWGKEPSGGFMNVPPIASWIERSSLFWEEAHYITQDGEMDLREFEPSKGKIAELAGSFMWCWKYENQEVYCREHWTKTPEYCEQVGDTLCRNEVKTRQIFLSRSAVQLKESSRRIMCALEEGGGISCWQNPVYDEIPSPVALPPAPGQIETLVAGYDEICGLSVGRVYCWPLRHIDFARQTGWIGEVYEKKVGNLRFESLDLVSYLGFDQEGKLWILEDPPTLAPGQRPAPGP